MHNEKQVIEGALSGNAECFRQIVDGYKNLVFSICLNMTGDRFEAENLVQETFIKVYSSLSTYGFRGFKTWVCRIAVNNCLDYRRKMAKRHEDLVSPEYFPVPVSECRTPVEEQLLAREEADALRRMCDSLPDKYRSIIKDFYIHSRSIREIAARGGIRIKTVETRLYRGLALLRRNWKEGFG